MTAQGTAGAMGPAVPTGPPVELPAEMRDEIVAHAREEAPRECCGLIAGLDGRAVHLYRLTNLAPSNSLYEIDPRQIYDLEFRQLPERGWEVLAIYHSHPVSEAFPSATDRSLAFWPDAYYLICSLADPDQPRIRAFKLTHDSVEESEIRFLSS